MKWRYLATTLLFAAVTAGILALLFNIQERKEEGKVHFVQWEELDDDNPDPAVWKKYFPRQYDGYARTVDSQRTKHGGSEFIPKQKLDADPFLKRLFAGYAFSIDFREARGHAYMLLDQDQTERVKQRPQKGACLHCHASVMPAYRKLGDGDVQAGFQKLCSQDWADARKTVTHPVTCNDCHDSKTAELRVTRPGFMNGIQALASSDQPVPHLPSIEHWRKGDRKSGYDPNKMASRQELRSFVCGQCHVEYYFKAPNSAVTYPWHKGLKADQIESYYEEIGFSDWKHAETGTDVLKAQHPEFEMWSQGVHARSGVSCADCHMPYKREGAVKISDHHVQSPMLNTARACQVCHRYPETEIQARVEMIQDQTKSLLDRAERATVDLIDQLKDAKVSMDAKDLKRVQKLHRQAQWRVDFVLSENSMGFHAPRETARLLAEAIDFARQGQIEMLKGSK